MIRFLFLQLHFCSGRRGRPGCRSFRFGDSLRLCRPAWESAIGCGVISRYSGKLKNPFPNLDPKLARAATIAEDRAHAHSRRSCWRYVKEALLAAGAVDSYPQTALARQAGEELVNRYGFTRLATRDPYQAPVGSVLVYGSGRAAGTCRDSNQSTGL